MTGSRGARRRRRVYPRIDVELGARLSAYCAKTALSETSVVEAALREHLDGTADRTLLFRRLDRLARMVARMQRDVELHGEAMALFIKVWFSHTPSLPPSARPAAHAAGEGRYRQFVKHVASQFSSGKRFLDDLPRETITDEAELAMMTREGQAFEQAADSATARDPSDG